MASDDYFIMWLNAKNVLNFFIYKEENIFIQKLLNNLIWFTEIDLFNLNDFQQIYTHYIKSSYSHLFFSKISSGSIFIAPANLLNVAKMPAIILADLNCSKE